MSTFGGMDRMGKAISWNIYLYTITEIGIFYLVLFRIFTLLSIFIGKILVICLLSILLGMLVGKIPSIGGGGKKAAKRLGRDRSRAVYI